MADPFILFSSDRVGTKDCTYSVTKFRDSIRKQWVLAAHTPGLMDVAAYFRSEEHARQFAETFGLAIKEADRG